MFVPHAFGADVAARIRERLCHVLTEAQGARADDPATSLKEQIHVRHSHEGSPFREAWTPRLPTAAARIASAWRW